MRKFLCDVYLVRFAKYILDRALIPFLYLKSSSEFSPFLILIYTYINDMFVLCVCVESELETELYSIVSWNGSVRTS